MHFNSSCSYCAVAYILSSFNIEVEDTDIALKIGLPYIFTYEKGEYLAGPMLQSSKYFNLFLNPLGLALKENCIKKDELLGYINDRKNVMFGLKTDFGKHAVVLINRSNNLYSFFNPSWEESNQEKIINLSKEDLLSRVDGEIVIGEIKQTQKTMNNLESIYRASLVNLEQYEKDILDFIDEDNDKEEYQKHLDSLFRPLLLDGLSMMVLINNDEIAKTMKEAQTLLLDFIRDKAKLNVLLFREKICIIITKYKEIIKKQLN